MEQKHHESQHEHHDVHKIEKKNDTVTITKTQLWQIVSGILGVLLLVSLFTGGFGVGESAGNAAAQPSAAAPSQPSQPSAPVEVSLDGARTLGDEDAPVTIIEFSDFECPFCGRFYSETLNQIKQNYVETGKVRFVYMDFPLDSIHPQARPAANAAWCAQEQDAFWPFHDKLFENQAVLSDASYKQWAADLGLDTAQFNSCLDSRKYDARVSEELQMGTGAGIRGTPGFLLNGQLISGAQPYAVFAQAIEQALA